ncbi:hypothetical protein glysoja_024845 [Glycine soja]|uniref:Uncharacterized protein n=1 Tax=Glycine soja TaxID=3848 RepID=A0A0B2QHS4_GLYSO|nr:hypothetical protein glysoja_024845 [Glycine soja]
MGSEITEPTSPKVTCAGQIKVRPKTTSCRSWQSVMEEIEKIHTDKKQRKRLGWAETRFQEGDNAVLDVFAKHKQENESKNRREETEERDYGNEEESVSVPPPNALLLMRCSSAPAKSWVREREKEKGEKKGQSLKSLMEKENVVVMRYDSDFYDISSEVGGTSDLMFRSRSWKT